MEALFIMALGFAFIALVLKGFDWLSTPSPFTLWLKRVLEALEKRL